LTVDDIGTRRMSWGEALRLLRELAADPSSHVAASIGGWERPVSYEAIVAMNTFDLMHMVAWGQGGRKGAKPKPYPRPWPSMTKKVMKPTVSQDEVIAALQFAGHTAPIPTREV
jgi:hypothetical protein